MTTAIFGARYDAREFPVIRDKRLAHTCDAMAFVNGRTVAVVGSSEGLLAESLGPAIDRCEIVLRFNRARPTGIHAPAIGLRTDIVCTGDISPVGTFRSVPWLWHLKPTTSGLRQLAEILDADHLQHMRTWRSPIAWFNALSADLYDTPRNDDEVYEGGNVGSGIYAVHLLERFGARRIDIFGVDCWGALLDGDDEIPGAEAERSWWQGDKQRRRVHDGEVEAAWLRARGVAFVARRWWRLTPKPSTS